MDLTRASARRKHISMSKLNKVATVEEAVALIGDNDWITTTGFVGTGIPEEIIIGVKERFEKTGHPRNLSLVFAAGQGDGKGRGVDLLSVHPGLLHTVIGGHYGLIPGIGKLALDNKVIAYNLPQGIISQMYRAVANKQPGIVSKIGLGTFVDPRLEGGKVNCLTKKDIVSVIQIGNEEYLHYQPFKLDVAFVRGTTADLDGNVTMEKEALTLDSLAIAMATKNCGGRVIVQVERLAAEGTLNPHQVKIPGVLVDYIVVSRPENHRQTLGNETYNAGFSGEVHVPTSSFLGKMPFSARKIICRRAALELKPYGIINLGIGVPEGVALIANEEKILKMLTMTAEPGIIGGIISGGLNFGTAVNPRSIIDQNTQFDFYDGGGLDTTFLGMAQIDQHGNVNVSKFGKKLAGCGGFINISQSTKHVVFLGTFTNGDTKIQLQSGKLVLHGDGETRKFVNQVQQITFSGKTAVKNKQHVIYITERCVFKLVEDGLELIEVAPGIDIDRDILPKMEFTPIIKRDSIRVMDPRIFDNKLMELRQSMIQRFLEHRIDYDAADNLLFIDLRGMKLTSFEDIDSIMHAIEDRCKEIGKQCFAIINYTTMQMDKDAIKELLGAEIKLSRTYFLKVSRFAVGNTLRYNLQTVLQKLDPNAVVFRSLEEAVEAVNFKAKL